MEKPASLRESLMACCQAFTRNLFDDYRPELHYMRGPGPKWREKHAGVPPQTGATPLFPEGIPA